MSYTEPEVYVPPEAADILCEDCHARYHADDEPCECAVDAYGTRGMSCGSCPAFYVEDWTWQEPSAYRWGECDRCGAQAPYLRASAERRDALVGRLECPQGCGPTMHFHARRTA